MQDKNLQTKVEDLFQFGRHHNIQVIYLAHYSKDVLPKVRATCFKIFITENNPDNFFEIITVTYSVKELKWKQYRDQLEFGIIDYDTRSKKYKSLNHKYKVILVRATSVVRRITLLIKKIFYRSGR